MSTRKFLTSICAASALALMAGAASAATINVSSIVGEWIGWTAQSGASNVKKTPTSDAATHAELRWGAGGARSGYDFDAAEVPFSSAEDTAFALGTFTHLNYTINNNTSIKNATLKVTYTFSIDGGASQTKSSTFLFDHWETPNADNPCADGGTNGSGINAGGCADRVIARTNAGASQTFEIGGVEYALDVTGFTVGGTPMTQFWTQEGKTNDAVINARFVTLSSIAPIPLPAGGLLLLGALGGLGVMRRRRKAA